MNRTSNVSNDTLNWEINCSNLLGDTGYWHESCKPEYAKQTQYLPLPLVICLLVLIHITGFVGNTTVVVIIVKKRRMQTYTNWLILNLAVADLAVAVFCIPLDIPLVVTQKWVYGKFFCSVYYPIGTATLLGSVLTLVTLTYTRFWAIRYPFRVQATVFIAKILIALIWAFSFALVIPLVLILKYDNKYEVCYESWSPSKRRIYTLFIFPTRLCNPVDNYNRRVRFYCLRTSYQENNDVYGPLWPANEGK